MELGNFELRELTQKESENVLENVDGTLEKENRQKSRFGKEFRKDDLEKLVEDGLSKKTESKLRWAVSLFHEWAASRSEIDDEKLRTMIKNDIKDIDNADLNNLMCYFLAEVRNKHGEDYKPNTLYEIVAAIQHYIRRNGKFIIFFDDTCFQSMRNILDAKMKELSKQGLGLETKKAEVISVDQEEIMWQKGILGTDTPQKLLDTLIYTLGLHFALLAGQEHRNLRFGNFSQINVITEANGTRYLEYREDVSKTYRGGMKHRKMEPKVTRAYENKENSQRFPVHIYEKYTRLRPKQGKTDALYLRPLRSYSGELWYMDCPVGVHLLTKTVEKLCAAAGFKGHFTNHSLRATAATRLYLAGVDEQLISEKTGHRSNSVRSYKRTNEGQLKGISSILHTNKNTPTASVSTESDEKRENDVENTREISITSGDMSFKLTF